MAEQNIEPFAYQKSTNINEHNQMVDKINEMVDGVNYTLDTLDNMVSQVETNTADIATNKDSIATNKDNIESLRDANIIITKDIESLKETDIEITKKLPTALDSEFNDGNRNLTLKLTTNDGTEYSTVANIPGGGSGGSGGDIVISNLDYSNATAETIIEDMLSKYSEGEYNCCITLYAPINTTNTAYTTSMASKMRILKTSSTTSSHDSIIFESIGNNANSSSTQINISFNLNKLTTISTGNITYNGAYSVFDNGSWISEGMLSSSLITIKGYIIKNVTGAAITPYTAGVGIDITDDTISVDENTIATKATVDNLDTQVKECASGVANAITQAQNAYNSASISDNHLVLTKGNGNSDEIVIPSGDGWENLDLSNLPTDFSSGDEINIILKVGIIAKAADWNTLAEYATITLSSPYPSAFFILTDTGTSYQYVTCKTYLATKYVSVLSISNVQNPDTWNTGAFLFDIVGGAFNAGGIFIPTHLRITRSNISEKVYRLYRKKSST